MATLLENIDKNAYPKCTMCTCTSISRLCHFRQHIGNMQNELQFDKSKELVFQPNFGVGFKYKGIQLDYALTNIASIGNALYSNVFSIKIAFDNFK